MTATGAEHTSSYFGDQAQRDLPHGSVFILIIRGWKICTKKWPKYACKYALKREKICIYICIYALKYAVNWSFSLITHDKNQNSFLLFIYLHMFIYKLKRNY
jgi:hypothetical protein